MSSLPIIWAGIPSSLPLVLYAATGFEATCALSNKIQDGKRNGPKAIMYSFAIMMILVFLFQFLFYTSLGTMLADQESYLGAFPALLAKLFPAHPAFVYKWQALLHLAIASSALGGCYGILYSNNWNLYILAQHKKIRGWSFFAKLNKHAIPYLCLFAEWCFCTLYILTSAGNQCILQQFAALGTTITYMISVLALLYAYRREQNSLLMQMIPFLALASCIIFMGACVRNFIIGGTIPLIGFCLLLLFGILIYNRKTE